MMRYKKFITFTSILIISTILIFKEKKHPISYWIWAGITTNDAPSNSELYIYQGVIKKSSNNDYNYQHIGLYPHPIKSKKLYLAYRLEGGLPDAKQIVSIFQDRALWWQSHDIPPNGLQLDFDAPTSKLIVYSNFLREVRQLLPKEYDLSITGLGDWIALGNKEAMKSITNVTNEIVFQLYQGKKPLKNIENYVHMLKNYHRPFRIGLLLHHPGDKHIAILKQNRNFKGVIYFIQKNI